MLHYKIIFFGLLCIVVFITNIIIHLFYMPHHSTRKPIIFVDHPHNTYLINNSGCRIQDQDLTPPEVHHLIFEEEGPICNDGKPPLVDLNHTSIFLIPQSFAAYNVRNEDELQCCYKAFWRVRPDPKKNEIDNLVRYSDECVEFKHSVKISDEFVMVQCSHAKKLIYKDYFAFVPPKSQSIRDEEAKVNVLIVGLDGLSRMNMHRQMPQTLDFLQRNDAIEFLGYNKVADYTFVNLIVMLSGNTSAECNNTCFKDGFYDQCKFIWDEYAQAGYKTAFVEDMTSFGLFFITTKGFVEQPTDYYGHNFFLETDNIIGHHNKRSRVKECLGPRLPHHVLLNYTMNFVKSMHDYNQPFYGHFWQSTLSHDFINKVRIGDNDYRVMLETFQRGGYLDNTVLFVMSDHGLRTGRFRQTYQGMLEDRLPALFILLPLWMRLKFPHVITNMRINSNRLVTLYDVHVSLQDLLKPMRNLNAHNLRMRNTNASSKSNTLFAPISEARTCEQAHIEAHWCACHNSTTVPTNDPAVIRAAEYAIKYINFQLQPYSDRCVHLRLNVIKTARRSNANPTLIEEFKGFVGDYLLVFSAQPSGAIFEATVRSTVKQNRVQHLLSGTISRLNMYGEQSHCVNVKLLKLYCYCKDL